MIKKRRPPPRQAAWLSGGTSEYRPCCATSSAAGSRVPLWFIEGMAEYVSLGNVDPNTTMWMRDAVRRGELPSFRDLENPRYFPYRWGQSFWSYLGGTYGDDIVGALLRSAGRSG